MIAFDTDVLTEILLGNDVFVERSAAISDHDQAVPVVVVEEMIRGRLHTIRQAEAGKSRISNEEPRSRATGFFIYSLEELEREIREARGRTAHTP